MRKTLRDDKGQFRGSTAEPVRVPDTGKKRSDITAVTAEILTTPSATLPIDVTYEKFRELNPLTNQDIAEDPTLSAAEK